jgi:hypothetical protein
MKVRNSDDLAWVQRKRKMRQVLGAFGLLDYVPARFRMMSILNLIDLLFL